MGQAVLLLLEPLALARVVEAGSLQILEQLLLALALLLQLQPGATGQLQGRRRPLPGPVGLGHGLQGRLEGGTAKAIQPVALLPGPGELLGLPLHGEIEQQGPQLLDLGAVHRHPIEPVATVEPAVAEAPFTAEQDLGLLGRELLLLQPGLQRRSERETGFDQAAIVALAQQAAGRAPSRAAEQGIQGIQQDRLAGAGFPGEHREATAEIELQLLDQGNVVKAQTGEHRRIR